MIKIPGYRLTERIYASKKSLVYLGKRERDEQAVLIKTPQSAYPSERALRHFHTSHEIADQFDHSGILNSIDVGVINNRHYVVFEYHGTSDLRQFQTQQPNQVFSISDFFEMAVQLADILSAIHHKNIIFKDLHPGNILIQPKTLQIQLADFGLASILSRESKSLDPPDYVEGVLGYVSPEQTGRMNRALDYRSDFYSLGVCFYVMLTGEMPFDEQDDLATIHASIAKHHPPAMTKRQEIPEILSRLIDKLLQKNAEDRYQSALGIKSDLQRCQKQWLDRTRIEPFPLGEDDISDQLELPQKLYGRGNELKKILDVFHRISSGRPEAVLVTGPNGIGKTSLIKEIQQHVALSDGTFIYGKLNTQEKVKPFQPFKQALKAWVNYNLSQEDSKTTQLKATLTHKLEHHLPYLLDFLPELAFLFNPVPVIRHSDTLSPSSKDELKYALHQFIKIIAQDKPLILLIDNLQWTDNDSQNLFRSLSSILDAKLLLIGCFRNSSVKSSHRLSRTLAHVSSHMPTTEIHLTPLTLNALKALLSDTLRAKPAAVEELAQITLQKTLGHPNLIHQFLESLYFKKLVNFNLSSKSWRWDITRIKQQEIDGRTAKLIVERIRHLPEDTQEALGLAACIGGEFELELLTKLTTPDSTIAQTQEAIRPAIENGIICQSTNEESHYVFAHKKVRKEAYKLIPEKQRDKTHHKIAFALMDIKSSHIHYPINYCVADHLNKARHLIKQKDQLAKLSALNLKAAIAAKQEENWVSVYNYCMEGLKTLDETPWKTQYSLTKSLTEAKLDATFRQGYFQQAIDIIESNIVCLETPEEKAEWCIHLLSQSQTAQQFSLSVPYGIQGLSFLGVPFSLNIDASDEKADISNLIAAIKSLNTITLSTPIKSTRDKLIQRLYGQLVLALYFSFHPDFYRLIEHAVKHMVSSGTDEDSAILLVFMAVCAIRCQQFPLGFELSDSAISILERFPNARYTDIIYGIIGSRVLPYKDTVANSLHHQMQGYDKARAKQNYIAATFNYLNSILSKFASAAPLDEVALMLKKLEKHQKLNHQTTFETQLLIRYVQALTNRSRKSNLEKASFTKDQWRSICQNSTHHLLSSLRFQFYFWSDQTDQIQAYALDLPTRRNFNALIATDYELMVHITYCRSKEAYYEATILEFIDKLETLAKLNAATFEHKWLLLKAEYSIFKKQPQLNTVRLYEQALKSAEAQHFIQFQAYANERLGDLWLDENNTEYAFINYRKALYLYRRWNCQLKANMLAKKTDMLKRQSKRRSTKTRLLDNVVPISSSRRNLTDNIDLMTVLRSSQAISRNMPLDSLLHQILTLILQNSGAQVATILLKQGRQLNIANYLDTDKHHTKNTTLPEEIINYVQKTKNVLLIQNTDVPSSFAQSEAVKERRVKSLLCSPILYRDTFMGVLYLENRITTNAFTLQRLNIINALLNQASISLENTRYHQDIEQLNKNLEEMVNVRTQDLQLINLELEELNYSMSHDLKAPLRSIKGFTQALVEDFGTHLNREALDYLNRIQKGSDKTTDMMLGLNQLYRAPVPRISQTMVNTKQLANQIITSTALKYRHHRPVVNNNLPLTFECDELTITHVLEILIDNAFKFTQHVENPLIEIALDSQASPPIFSVKDNGIGFNPILKHRLFHNFQRLHSESTYPGAGLGLATARKAVERFNGKIWAMGQPNRGSTFSFTLGLPD